MEEQLSYLDALRELHGADLIDTDETNAVPVLRYISDFVAINLPAIVGCLNPGDSRRGG